MGGSCPPQLLDRGDIISFVHPNITVGNVSPALSQGINKKNEHYHWTICGHSIQIYYVN